MNDIDGVIKGPKSPTTEPRCHSDQVDPLVRHKTTTTSNQEYQTEILWS